MNCQQELQPTSYGLRILRKQPVSQGGVIASPRNHRLWKGRCMPTGMRSMQFPASNRDEWANGAIALAVMVLFSLLLSGCMTGGGNGGGGGPTFSLTMTPTFPVIGVGLTKQFSTTTVDASGNPITVSGITIAWSSSDTTVATIDSSTGLATAVAVGSTTITANASNTSGNGVAMQITTLKVTPALVLNSAPLPLGALTIPYVNTGLQNSGGHSGGAAPLTWSLVSGTTLPAGLILNSDGTISGTPTTAGVSPNFTIQITDSETPPVSEQATFSMIIVDPVNSPCGILTNTNAGTLNGKYAFLLQGFQASTTNGTPVAMVGSFTADGSGGITGGELDMNNATAPQHLTINGGTYAVNAKGQGCVQLKYSTGASNVFHFALSQQLNASNIATHGRIIEYDGYQGTHGGSATNLTSGVLLLQNPAEFSASSLAARFAFGEDGFDMAGKHVALGGTFNIDTSGNMTNLAEDFDDGGTINTFTGATGTASSTATTGTTGRETVAITLPGPSTFHLTAYVVNSNEMFLVSSDAFSGTYPVLSGRAVVTGNSYTASSFSGNYIARAGGVDFQGDGAACAANGPCALVEIGVLNADGATGALGGTLYQSQAGTTQSTSVSKTTYSVDVSTGRVQLSSTGGGNLPVLYLAAPVTSATDTTEPIAAVLVGSGPTLNSNNGDPTALFGLIEEQPNGPYILNSPPSYILASEDLGQITAANVVGNGTFSAGIIPINRDISNISGLTFNAPTNFSFSVNADGTMTGTLGNSPAAGVTNSTFASPGKALFVQTNSVVAQIRTLEP